MGVRLWCVCLWTWLPNLFRLWEPKFEPLSWKESEPDKRPELRHWSRLNSLQSNLWEIKLFCICKALYHSQASRRGWASQFVWSEGCYQMHIAFPWEQDSFANSQFCSFALVAVLILNVIIWGKFVAKFREDRQQQLASFLRKSLVSQVSGIKAGSRLRYLPNMEQNE